MKINKPSKVLDLLRTTVKSGRLSRGYGWLLANVPDFVWGGPNIHIMTQVGDMVVPVKDPASTGLMLWGEILHEIHESRIIRHLGKTCDVVCDIGAHMGWYSRLISANMQHAGRIYAFEPNPVSYSYLQENTCGHSAISIYPLAVSDSAQPITFYCAESSNLSSAVRQVGRPVVVTATTLDEFCDKQQLYSGVDFVKCDVEGGELAVLRGSRRLRASERAPIWMIEVDDGFLSEAEILLDQLNAEIHAIDPTVHLYYLNDNGQPCMMRHIAERHAPNIFIVPNHRLEQFEAAAQPRI